MLKNKWIILFSFFLFFGIAGTVHAANYCVKATGSAAKADSTVADAATCTAAADVAAMSMATFSVTSDFTDGDIVYFTAVGGDFATTMTIASSGSAAAITYQGIADGTAGATPVVDAGVNKALAAAGKSYFTVQDMNFISSGNNSVFISGAAGTNVTFNRVEATSARYTFNISQPISTFNIDTVTSTVSGPTGYALYMYGDSNSDVTVDSFDGIGGQFTVNNVNNVSITNSTSTNSSTGGFTFQTITGAVTIDDNTVTGAATGSYGFWFNISSGMSGTISRNTVTDTDSGGFWFDDIVGSPSITLANDTVTSAAGSGYGFAFTGVLEASASQNITINDATITNSGGDSFLWGEYAHDITCNRCRSSYNGTYDSTGGDAFTAHATNYNIVINNSIADHNTSSGTAFVETSSGQVNNTVFYSNSYGDVGPTPAANAGANRANIYLPIAGNNPVSGEAWTFKNVASYAGAPYELNTTNLNVFDYNMYYPVDNAQFVYLDSVVTSWADYASNEPNSTNQDPLFTSTTDYTPTELSPLIDAGTDLGLTTDYLGNPIYGAPDIGAYEYQPPYEIGTDEIDISGNVRIYDDGMFRNTAAASATTADMQISPSGGFTPGDYDLFLDVAISEWLTSGAYSKTWTETSANASLETAHTIGDLEAAKYYAVNVDDVLFGTYLSNGSGEITFTYDGGYSSHEFNIELDPVPTVSTLTPTDGGIAVIENSNFVIVFNEIVTVGTGNITIKKLSNDSIVETIDVTSGQVTGTGTTTITINPTFTFESLVDYYIQIDATAFDDAGGNSYAGITDTTSWNFKSFNALGSVNVSVPEPNVKVLYPKGGETLLPKETIEILWSTDNYPAISNVSIYFQSYVGEDFELIDTVKSSLGKYEWVAPDIETKSATIKMVLLGATNQAHSYSDYVFSIAPAISETAPSTTTTETPVAPVDTPEQNTEKITIPSTTPVDTNNPAEFANYSGLVQADAKEFAVELAEGQVVAITNFVTHGASKETIKLGSGERRAVIRDYFETVGRPEVIWEDVQRITTGQKPVNRNLTAEQAKVGRVLDNFILMTGHAPNFEDPAEDIAWNAMMYRIRFPRDLSKERMGIGQFEKIYRKSPSTPLEWSIVRTLGYVLN